MSMIQYYSLLSTTINYVYDDQGGSASPELEDTLSSPRRPLSTLSPRSPDPGVPSLSFDRKETDDLLGFDRETW